MADMDDIGWCVGNGFGFEPLPCTEVAAWAAMREDPPDAENQRFMRRLSDMFVRGHAEGSKPVATAMQPSRWSEFDDLWERIGAVKAREDEAWLSMREHFD